MKRGTRAADWSYHLPGEVRSVEAVLCEPTSGRIGEPSMRQASALEGQCPQRKRAPAVGDPHPACRSAAGAVGPRSDLSIEAQSTRAHPASGDERATPCILPRVRVGVSACLLGQGVRFDGGHKRDDVLTGALATFLDLVPVCPEVGIGMGVPRPPIRLVGDSQQPRAVGVDDATPDVTEQLLSFARRHVSSLGDISGYILKRSSPSCGMAGVKVYDSKGTITDHKGVGIFARVLMEAKPLLPVVEETCLKNLGSGKFLNG